MASHEDYQSYLERDHRLAMVAMGMLGAADYHAKHPDYATVAVKAEAWDRFVARLREADAS